jgi:hypothetical protein
MEMYIEHPEISPCTAMQLPSKEVGKEDVKKGDYFYVSNSVHFRIIFLPF